MTEPTPHLFDTGNENNAKPLLDESPNGFWREPGLPFAFLRVGLYVILWQALEYGLSRALQSVLGAELTSHFTVAISLEEGAALAAVLLAAWAMSRLEKRPFGTYGLPARKVSASHFGAGVLFGLAELSAVLGAVALFGGYRFGSLAVHGTELLRWALIWGLFFLAVGFYEEFSLRGYLQYTLAQGTGFWPAAVVLSVIFGLLHARNPGETWAGITSVIVAGLFWCFTLQRTGSLWFAVGMHASFDFAESFLYSVPDSGALFPGHLSHATLSGPSWLTGGSAGPEASVFDFAMLAIFFYVFHLIYPAKNLPQKPD